MYSLFPKAILSTLATLLVLGCSADKSLTGNEDIRILPNVDTFGEVGLSARTEPMVWYGSYDFTPQDSILPGETTRTPVDSSLKEYCKEDANWWHYVHYTPLYQSREVFEKRIIATTDSVPLLNPGKLMVSGNYKFVTDVNRGVHIFDDTDPRNPRKVAFINIPGTLDIALKNNTLLANAYSALVAIDITNPAQAQLKSLLPAAFPPVYVGNAPIMDSLGNVAVAWVADTVWTCGYYMVGVEDGSVPLTGNGTTLDTAQKNVVLGQNASMSRFTLSADWLYTVDLQSLRLFDITNETNPRKGAVVETGRWELETIFRSDSVLYIGAMTGMHIYVHGSAGGAPVAASSYSHVTSCDPVVVQKGIAYVTLRTGTRCRAGSNELDIVDVRNPYKPEELSRFQLTNPAGLAVEDSTLYVCEGNYGLTILDVKNPSKPSIVSNVREARPEDIIANGGILTLIGSEGIWRYDATNRLEPVLLSYTPSQPLLSDPIEKP